ncbi:DUF2207 domain-containing protein [Aldersonia sp. NBC_00410]|uniref:DUF2207 family protein n=1 Tax=Aldersonia sp. NBC_00410 TaxID=2975954 RepID=UPI00225A9431|nr:DUF2207 domain-containing protein [Aldersonia sp. NBC_00410]MCX5043374.1 DUF2207 domain-containing protein [Aldersonia sp. NBC_00410]
MDAMTFGVLVAAAAALLAWFAILGALMRATRTPRIERGVPTGNFGPESPAVVDFITGEFRLCDEAASATLLDLAARRIVTIEEVGPELSLVRVRRNADTAGLTRYEHMVLAHVHKLATADGVVATGALAEGARHLGGWWKKFAKAVRDETRAAGLSQARWQPWHRTLLTIAAVVPALGVGALFAIAEPATDGDPFGGFVAGVFVTIAVLVAVQEKINGERGTEAGAQAAGRWLGVQEHLGTGRFAEQPAAGVTIWGRALAYAAALGLAERAVVSLPIGTAADDGKAWSDFGGMWHLVHVRYHGRGPWGRIVWGYSAWAGIGRGLFAALIMAGPTFIVAIVLSAFLGFPGDPVRFAVLFAAVLAAGPIALAVLDLGGHATVRGQVVRQRQFVKKRNDENVTYRYWIGIDDGRARITHAYGIDEKTWNTLAEGDIVEARVGKRLGWIYDVRVVTPSRHRPAADPQGQADLTSQ